MLSSHPYGYRMDLSTTLAIYDMQENILENLGKGFYLYSFCDLSKAIDTIDFSTRYPHPEPLSFLNYFQNVG